MGKGIAPLWLKLGYAAFVAVLIPVYWIHYGPGNFLWFSDVALFAGLVALWREDSWLPSMMAVAVLVPELAWNIGFFFRLLTGIPIFDLTNYMFDSDLPLYLRGLSLFHVIIPPVLIWLIYRLGYDRRGFWFATIMAWILLPLSYLLTEPSENINWVYGFGDDPQDRFHPLAYLGMLMLFFPVAIYLPTHLALRKIFRKPHPKQHPQ
ncbi:MAG: membrane-associated protein [Verrucomicrobia bacterium]|nr:membrane-associated protein [Verrucomicrobiota bacterium]